MPLLIPLKSTKPFWMILALKKHLFHSGQNYQWKKMATPSTKMVFLAVRMIPHFLWNGKGVNLIWEANFPAWSLYALKWNGNTTVKPKRNAVSAAVRTPVPHLPVEEWFTFTPKRICVPIPVWTWFRRMDETYKIRVNVEKSINHFKDSFCIAGRKTQNEKTLHADLLLAGISQLITVMVADKIHQHQYIRSLKPLIA